MDEPAPTSPHRSGGPRPSPSTSTPKGAELPAPRVRHRSGGWRFTARTSGTETAARAARIGLGLLAARSAAVLDRLGPETARRDRDRRRSERLAAVVVAQLGALKGVFVKAGQFAAVRYDVLPPEWRGPLASLREQVPPLPFERIRERVETELGCPLEDAFARFDPVPVGAASVAQVHRAELHGGGAVAVKVLYPWIAEALPGDLRFLRRAMRWWSGARARRLDVDRLLQEFEAGLRTELDLEHEAATAREIAANLADDPRIVVPAVVPERSTREVLTVTFYPTLSLADRAALDARGIDAAEVLSLLARAYAKQIFVDGLFHADPHPGNVFVIDEPGAAEAPRLLFVDFGLSMRLSKELRRATRQGIYALLQRDLDGFLARMDELGMIAPGAHDDVRAAVARMFGEIADAAGAAGAIGLSGGRVLDLKDQAKQLLEETPGLQLPNDLLLYARTLSYLFGLGRELAPEVDLMQIVTPYLLRFLAEKDPA